MKKIQKYPKTIGTLVDVKDPSIYYNDEGYTESADTNQLDEVLEHLVDRVDVIEGTYNVASYGNRVLLKGTDGNDYLIACAKWESAAPPTINANDVTVTSKEPLTFTITAKTADQIKWSYTTEEKTVTGITNGKTATISITPSFNTYKQEVKFSASTIYLQKESKSTSKTINITRKLKLTLSYAPSTPGEYSDMYYSAYGKVMASTNYSLCTNASFTPSPVWYNKWTDTDAADTHIDNNGASAMTFYQDTSDIYFKLSDTNTGDNAWEAADEVKAEDMLIRHLRLFTINEISSRINSGIYEPWKKFEVIVNGKTYNVNGSEAIPVVTYGIDYVDNTRGYADVVDARLSTLAETPTVHGNCTVTATTNNTGETINGVTYAWKSQSNSLEIKARNLPSPTITYVTAKDEKGVVSKWSTGTTFTITASTVYDDDGTTVVDDGIEYSITGGTTPSIDYINPFILTANTIAANSVVAQRIVDTWTSSPLVTSPASTITQNTPYVYYGTFNFIGTAPTTSNVNTYYQTTLTIANYQSIMKSDDIVLYKFEGFPMNFKSEGQFLQWDKDIANPILIYPKSFGEVANITDGAQPYNDTFGHTIKKIGQTEYYVYYYLDRGTSVDGGDTITFIFTKE